MSFSQRDVMVCASKRRYLSKRSAREKNTKPYKCPICFCWHRTTVKKIHDANPLKDSFRIKKLRYYY